MFAIPGSIHSPLSKGCHHLIKQGAKLVDDANDILIELEMPPRVSAKVAASPATTLTEDKILSAMGYDPVTIDSLVEITGKSADKIMARLTALELDGTVASLPGGKFQRLG